MSEEAVTEAPEAPAEAPEGAEQAAEAAPAIDVDAVKAEYEAKVAQALNAAKERERELFELKHQYEGTSGKLSELEKLQEELRTNPMKALETYGHSYDGLTRDLLEGKYEPLSPEQQKLQATEKELSDLKAQLEEFRGQYTQATESAEFRADLALVRQAADAEEFSVLRDIAGDAEFESLTQALRDEVKQGKQVSVEGRLREAQDGALQRLRSYLASEAISKAIVSDPKTKEALRKALQAGGESSESEAPAVSGVGDGSGNGPRTISNDVASSAATKGNPRALSEDERRARAAAKLDAILRAKRERQSA